LIGSFPYRFVIVEPMHDSSRGLTREKQVAQHDIAIEIVVEFA